MSPFPTIPGFEFTALLGRGGMASVYAARQPALGRDVAIKVVEARGEDAAQYLQRLENEAQSLAGLRHPNIVALYEFGRTSEGALYYVMPLLEGGDLTRGAKPWPEAELVELLDILLDALGHAHAADIVHRDIKPENILFDAEQRPMLADFGAALRRHRSRLTDEGVAIGSTGYMSPEQARGGHVDARSDLYSVAVLAFEMLTGELPFDGPDALAVALAQYEKPIPGLPAGLGHWQPFFLRALAFDPAQRFTSAEQMREALCTVQRTRAPRRRLRWHHAAALFACAAPLLAVLWLGPGGAVDAEEIASLIERNALLPPLQPNALDLLVDARARSPADLPLQALQAQLLDLLAMEMAPVLQRRDLIALQPLWARWRATADRLGAGDGEVARAHEQPVEQLLLQTLRHSVAHFDPAAAVPALQLLDAWPQADDSLHALAEAVRRLPLEGERFRDPDGPELLLVRKPQGDEIGLAVMTTAVQTELYQRFARATGRTPTACPAQHAGSQACLDLTEAQALAAWLSGDSGASYRLPTRRELESVMSHVATAPLHAWTTTCNAITTTTRPAVPRRVWGGVKSMFGGRSTEAGVERRCEGHFALPLDGQGRTARAFEGPGPSTTAVLLREVRSGIQ
jgi:serine/threonine-protein kinase PpkA